MIRQITSVYLAFAMLAGLPAVNLHAATADLSVHTWTNEHRGQQLDLTGYDLTFADEFDADSITDQKGGGRWIAPGHADVGASKWDKPLPENGIYTVEEGVLKIRASLEADGKWHSGSIQTVDKYGKGFAQQYGYFEAKMKFPAMPGAWCAFWLKSQAEHWDPSIVRAEVDVVEWYGGDAKGHHQSIHLRPPEPPYLLPGMMQKHGFESNYTGLPGLAGEWHTHGVLITPELTIMYVDRIEVSRFPTLDELKTPLYPLVSLTLYNKDLARAVSPFDMQVDYVRIYSAKPIPNPPILKDAS